MTPKKILIRIGSLRHGGAEKTLTTFLKNIPENKYEIDLLLNLKSGIYLEQIPSWINIKYLNKGEMITTNRIQDIPIKVYRKIYQGILEKFPKILYENILNNKKYDIEFIANNDLLEEVLKSPLKDSKKIVWVHTDVMNNPKYSLKTIKNYFNADKILVISEKIKKDFEKISPNSNSKKKIIKIFNPVDTNEIIKKSKDEINDYDFDSIPTFISIGTIYPIKGFDRIINAHKKLMDKGFKNKILIIGNGEDYNKLEKMILELKLEKTVKLLGLKKNPYPYLKKSDYYILSSRNEGYPTVLLEAIILEKPVIATNVSGVEDILLKGKLGMIVENSDEAIYEGMKKFIVNKSKSQEYIEEINKTKLPFTLEKSVKNLMKIIDDL